ncbi:MAG: DUF1552 domain-containing protein, partial [Myxococcales bacterium]|nr:DUF1552 domain-containing protein [Myxococcales bacterium]
MTKRRRSVQRQVLGRRTFLRGALGGAGVTIALPTLECMLNDSGTAEAQGGALPKRFGTYFWGGGIVHRAWVPSQTGMGWTPPDTLAAFTDLSPSLKEYMTVVTGVNHRYVGPGHIPARGIALSSSHNTTYVTGTAADGYRKQQHPEPSLDVLVADAFRAAGINTLKPSLHVATTKASPYFGNMSWRAGGAINDPYDSPANLYNELFSNALPDNPGDSQLLERTTKLEQSMLDAVMGDTARLK